MTIEEAKNLKTIIVEELLGSLITHEYTWKKTKLKEQYISKKKKKDLTLQLLLNCDDEVEDDGDMTLIFRKFKEL